MAKAILMKGGSGGVASDDVTASKFHVLQGYKTVTTDSNDEVVEGTIPKRGTWSTASEVVNASWESTVHVRFEEGYYNKDGQYKPTAKIPYAVLTNVLGIDANKMLDTLTVAGVRGVIPNRGNIVDTVSFENAYWDSKFLARMEQGFYSQNGQYKPCVAIPYAVLAQTIGVDRSKMLDTLTIAGRQGQIKSINTQDNNYRVNKSAAFGIDWWSDTNNPVFWIDFPHGNGYYNRPDGHPHTCIDAVNLGDVTADKVMRGFTATSKNGVKFAGTMPDLQSGRVVFSGATFDNEIASGVASKGFYLNGTYFAYSLNQNYGYAGVYNGGMNFNLSTGYPTLKSRRIGCVLSQSINLTPFRQIVISYRTLANIQGNPYATLEAHVNRVSTRRLIDVAGAGKVDAIDILRQGTASPAINRSGQIVLNVADINEQAFISFGAYCNSDRSSDVFAGAVQITKIEFIN